MGNRKAFGYVADISENDSENAEAPYRFTIFARIAFLGDIRSTKSDP